MDRLPDEISQLQQQALLHAAGELAAEEAAAFEREVLESDEAQQTLEAARILLADTAAGMAALRKAEVVADRSVRRARDRAAKAIFSWVEVEREAQVLRLTPRHPLAEGMVWRYARWPLAAAAVLVVGLVIWTFSAEPGRHRDFADGRPLTPVPGQQVGSGNDPSGNSPAAPSGEGQLDQIAALFDNPARDGSALFAGGLSDQMAALRLLEEPDYE